MKVRLLIRATLILLEILAQHTETILDDIAIQKIKELVEKKEKKNDNSENN